MRTVYDPCCGSGGMLMIAKEHITEGLRRNGDRLRPAINAQADIHLFGQEVNPETWAVSKSDFFMKDPTGRDADNVAFGSTLSNDRHASQSFDYLIANPPYGKDWKRDRDTVTEEHERGAAGRFGPGLPRISDGQTLFLLHMLAHAKGPDAGRLAYRHHHERLAALHRATRAAGRARSAATVFEHDLLEALIALAGATLLQHRHRHLRLAAHQPQGGGARRGKVQLIDATVLLGTDAPEPRRQAPGNPAGASAADILDAPQPTVRDGDTRVVTKDGKDE